MFDQKHSCWKALSIEKIIFNKIQDTCQKYHAMNTNYCVDQQVSIVNNAEKPKLDQNGDVNEPINIHRLEPYFESMITSPLPHHQNTRIDVIVSLWSDPVVYASTLNTGVS